MTGAKLSCHICQIKHGGDIDPAIGNGNDNVGLTETERQTELHGAFHIRDFFAQ